MFDKRRLYRAAICFGAALLVPAPVLSQQAPNGNCCGENANAPGARSNSLNRQTRDRLSTLERVAVRRAAQTVAPVSPQAYPELVRAAAKYASAVAGDDNAQFTALATSALQQAILAKQGAFSGALNLLSDLSQSAPFAAAPGPDALTERLTEPPIWDRPELQANYRSLMTMASEPDAGLIPITGPPVVARIVGPGTQVVPADGFRDCVAVGRRIGGQDQYCCTGTLISRNVVVTAGHCFFCTGGGSPNAVVFIGSNISDEGETHTGKVFRHPEYNQGGKANDLAVIVLDSPVADIPPRPVATSDQVASATFVRAVGFGNSDFASTSGFGTKRMVDVPIASVNCAGEDDANLGCDPDLELVAGFVGLGPDSCNGDSGGPVYLLVGDDAREDDAWVVCGATSRATELATRPCGDGGVYVRLDRYLDFIESIPGAEFP